MKPQPVLLIGTLIPVALAACATTPRPSEQADMQQMLTLLLPSKIEIVEPFTRVASFDDDEIPDGIELLLRAINALDNPNLMIAGRVKVELYEFVPASGQERGRRLEHWDIDLITAEDQRTYWNPLAQMYEFRLGIDRAKIPVRSKYILVVTYLSPTGDRLTDQCVMDAGSVAIRPSGRPLRGG